MHKVQWHVLSIYVLEHFIWPKLWKGYAKIPYPFLPLLKKLSFQFLNGREFHYVKFSKIQNFGKWSKFIPILCIYNLLRSVLPHYAHSIFFLFCCFWEFWAVVQPKLNTIAKLSPSPNSNFRWGLGWLWSWLIWSPTYISLNLHLYNNDPLRKVIETYDWAQFQLCK